MNTKWLFNCLNHQCKNLFLRASNFTKNKNVVLSAFTFISDLHTFEPILSRSFYYINLYLLVTSNCPMTLEVRKLFEILKLKMCFILNLELKLSETFYFIQLFIFSEHRLVMQALNG